MKLEIVAIKLLRELSKKGDEGVDEKELKKFKIGKNKFGEIIGFLSHKNLIIKLIGKSVSYRISTEGRIFLQNFIKEKSQHEFNKMVAFTGSILALIGIYNFFMSFESLQGNGIINGVFIWLLFMCFAPLVMFVINFYKNWMIGR